MKARKTMENRYERQMAHPWVGQQGQATLQSSRVLVLGLGGIGAPALPYLAGAGIGHIGLCDPDVVTLHNLHRQTIYSPDEAGASKVRRAAETLSRLNPLVAVSTWQQSFDQAQGPRLLVDYDAVLEGTDDLATKFLVHDLCRAQGKLLVSASLHQDQGQIQVFDYRGDARGPCLRCLWPEEPPQDCVRTCAQSGILGPAAGALALAATHELLGQLLGHGTLGKGRMATYDWARHQSRLLRWGPREGCSCGRDVDLREDTMQAVPTSVTVLPLLAGTRDSGPTLDSDTLFIDIREEHEVQPDDRVLLPQARLIPLSRWEAMEAGLSRDQGLVLVCEGGIRSRDLARSLAREGYTRVRTLEGGYRRLREAVRHP